MGQELVTELPDITVKEEENANLVICKSCNHLVPKTMLCLYCGTPILFKMPKNYVKR